VAKGQCVFLLRYLEYSIYSYKVGINTLLIKNHHWSHFYLCVVYHWCRTKRQCGKWNSKSNFWFTCFNTF